MDIEHFKPFILTSLVLTLLFVISRLLLSRKNLLSKFTQSEIAIKSSVSLGGRSKLAVVEVDGQRLLLGVTDSSITKISELTPESEVAAAEAASQKQLG